MLIRSLPGDEFLVVNAVTFKALEGPFTTFADALLPLRASSSAPAGQSGKRTTTTAAGHWDHPCALYEHAFCDAHMRSGARRCVAHARVGTSGIGSPKTCG